MRVRHPHVRRARSGVRAHSPILVGLASLATALAAVAAGAASPAIAVSARSASQPRISTLALLTTDFAFHLRQSAGPLQAGLVRLQLTNDGRMDHEAQLARLHRGVSVATFVHVLRTRGEAAALALVDFTGGAAPTAVHATQTTYQLLTVGHYLLLCLVVGPDGIPHVMKGMYAPVTVTGRFKGARPPGRVQGTITAHDMTYTLPAVIHGHGLYRFLDTDHTDVHELAIVRLHSHIDRAEVIAWFRHPAGPPPFTSAGGFGAVSPGGGWLLLSLPPGRYAALCYVPDRQPPHAPHAAMGMVVTFIIH